MRILAGEARENIYATNWMVMISAMTVYFFVVSVALVLCLCLEFPITAILKQFMKRDSQAKKEFDRRKMLDSSEQIKDSNANLFQSEPKKIKEQI